MSKNQHLEIISDFIFKSKYSRYQENLGRREDWAESVERVLKMHLKKYNFLSKDDKEKIKSAFKLVKEKKVMPSMRALENSTPILTTTGWKKAGDISKNDILFSSNGMETKVLDVVKFQNRDLYELRFSDNSSITACSEHLWIVNTSDDFKNKKKARVVDTLFIKNHLKQSGKNNISIKNPEPVIFAAPVTNLKINPYILGLWLGDGYSSGQAFASKPGGDSLHMERAYNEAGYKTYKAGEKNKYAWNIDLEFKSDLKHYNLINNKHIPEDYLYSNMEDRISLLQGLMDTDGCCHKGRCLFSNVNEKIISKLKFILSSLGIKYTESIRKETPNKQKLYNISFFPTFQVFRMARKVKILEVRLNGNNNRRTQYRKVTSVTYKGKGDATCFHVNSNDNSFLAGERLIVTHNSLQFSGPAIEAHQARQYNCATRHVDSLRAFAEIFYLALCGCGIGIGVSKYFLNRLPDLVNESDKNGTIITYVIEDSIEGWSDSVEALLNCYFKNTPYTGRKIVFDYSRIRKKGALLKTGGGKAPGYKGLKNAHQKIKSLLDHIIEYNKQTKLLSINAYDILMHCMDAVLSGGIRRSATSILFDKDDLLMLNAKTNIKVDKIFSFDEIGEVTIGGYTNKIYEGKIEIENIKYDLKIKDYELKTLKDKKEISWGHIYPQRARSNNSIILKRSDTTKEEFASIIDRTRQWGEPGFVFVSKDNVLLNPCFEISMLPVTEGGVCGVQYCNLTTLNGRLINTKESFKEFVEAYVIIGTLQAGYTDFPYLSNTAKFLTEQEALLGCSITGIMDNPDILLNYDIQREMANYAKNVNEEWAKKIKINPSARITCIKPEGTASLLLGTASGIHPHHSKKYFRRVQCNKLDPVYKLFKKTNPHMCEPSVWSANQTDDVITFPIEIHGNGLVKSDLSALKHLEIIKNTQINWVKSGSTEYNSKGLEHNVSCTVVVDENEWDSVIDYIYKNKEYFCAVSLLPKIGDKLYSQAPMESITDEKDLERWDYINNNMKPVDYNLLKEDEDNTNLSSEAACAGGACEIVRT